MSLLLLVFALVVLSPAATFRFGTSEAAEATISRAGQVQVETAKSP